MKQALCLFSCDQQLGWDTCGEESPPETSWFKARAAARERRWWLGPGGAALCPDHAAARRRSLSLHPNGGRPR